jgi:hypothetical protein
MKARVGLGLVFVLAACGGKVVFDGPTGTGGAEHHDDRDSSGPLCQARRLPGGTLYLLDRHLRCPTNLTDPRGKGCRRDLPKPGTSPRERLVLASHKRPRGGGRFAYARILAAPSPCV